MLHFILFSSIGIKYKQYTVINTKKQQKDNEPEYRPILSIGKKIIYIYYIYNF